MRLQTLRGVASARQWQMGVIDEGAWIRWPCNVPAITAATRAYVSIFTTTQRSLYQLCSPCSCMKWGDEIRAHLAHLRVRHPLRMPKSPSNIFT